MPLDLPAQEALADRALLLVLLRLQTAEDVARAKRASGAPVDDPAREARVLADGTLAARRAGLPPGRLEAVLRDGIAASKAAQRRWLARWAFDPVAPGPSLARDVRPRLDALLPRLAEAVRSLERVRPEVIERRARIVGALAAAYRAEWPRAVASLRRGGRPGELSPLVYRPTATPDVGRFSSWSRRCSCPPPPISVGSAPSARSRRTP